MPNIMCDNCGACCMHMQCPPLCADGDEALLGETLTAEVDDYLESPRYADVDRPCFWLNMADGTCVHHDRRPFTCREFVVGGSDCLAARKRLGIKDG